MLSLNEQLSEVLLLRLYERPFIHRLYFICERNFYARTHVKITRQWKSTLRVSILHYQILGQKANIYNY